MSNIISELEKEQLRADLPEIEVGDTVRVFVKVIEGNRERLQNFESPTTPTAPPSPSRWSSGALRCL